MVFFMACFTIGKSFPEQQISKQPLVVWHGTAQAQRSTGDMHTHEEPLHPECHQAQQTHLFHAAVCPTLISIHLISLEASEMLPSPSHGRLKKLSLENAFQQDKAVVQPPHCSQQSSGGTGTALPYVPSNSQRNQSHIFVSINVTKKQLKTTFFFLFFRKRGLPWLFPAVIIRKKGNFVMGAPLSIAGTT